MPSAGESPGQWLVSTPHVIHTQAQLPSAQVTRVGTDFHTPTRMSMCAHAAQTHCRHMLIYSLALISTRGHTWLPPLLLDSPSLGPHHIWIGICRRTQGCELSVRARRRALDTVTITTQTRMQVLAWRSGISGGTLPLHRHIPPLQGPQACLLTVSTGPTKAQMVSVCTLSRQCPVAT